MGNYVCVWGGGGDKGAGYSNTVQRARGGLCVEEGSEGGAGGGEAQGSPDHPNDVLQGCNYEIDVPVLGLIFEHDYVSLSVHESV